MGEYVQHVVDLDADLSRGDRLAAETQAWLLDEGIVVPNRRRDLWQPSELLPGPRAQLAAPFTSYERSRPDNGAELFVGHLVRHAGENLTAPPCPACGQTADLALLITLAADWRAGVEPSLRCGRCATTNRLGDWAHGRGIAVGTVSLDLHNWPPLHPTFVAEVGARWAPDRWVHLHARW